jgi:hypothetical protein
METPAFRNFRSDALGYWEPRRLAYNGLLGVIVVFYFFRAYPASKAILTLDSFLGLFLLAELVNLGYCAAYVADLFAQVATYRDLWRRYRWVFFVSACCLPPPDALRFHGNVFRRSKAG